jgi:hypothetical protein
MEGCDWMDLAEALGLFHGSSVIRFKSHFGMCPDAVAVVWKTIKASKVTSVTMSDLLHTLLFLSNSWSSWSVLSQFVGLCKNTFVKRVKNTLQILEDALPEVGRCDSA